MEYRKDIQVLRGIAVLLVVLFHLEVAGFKSGFLGVDVFFVISGYLMAVMYDRGKKLDFFLKRAKRLLPAYFATILLTIIGAVFLTTPNDYSQVLSQSHFALFFASNVGFWLENSYFDKAAFKPLLHLWSLGVEIQFYIFVPLIAWVVSKGRLYYFLILAGSAAVCFLVLSVSPKTSFFMMPLRLWEFLLGYGAAQKVLSSRDLRERKSLLGVLALLVIVVVPFLPVDGAALNFSNGHPGLIALMVSCATGAALLFGLPKKVESNAVFGALEKPEQVKIVVA